MAVSLNIKKAPKEVKQKLIKIKKVYSRYFLILSVIIPPTKKLYFVKKIFVNYPIGYNLFDDIEDLSVQKSNLPEIPTIESSEYGHISRWVVSKKEIVKQGQIIGFMGSTGNSTGPHLHFGVLKNKESDNPLKYLPKP